MEAYPLLKAANAKECIKAVQTFLKFAIGGRDYRSLCPAHAAGIVKPLPITRKMDTATTAYLRCFREWKGLRISNSMSPPVWRKMLQMCKRDSGYRGIPVGDTTVRSFKDYWFCNPSAESVYLTFDDGPAPGYTERVLDILEQKGVSATFFVLGWRVDASPKLAKTVFDDGHSIQNHTYGHPTLTTYSDNNVRWQIDQGNLAVLDAVGVWPSCLRPPYGVTSTRVNSIAAEFDLDVIIWDVNSGDYAHQSSSGILMSSATWGAGDVILGHDTWGRIWDDVLAQIIDNVRDRGLEFDRMCENPTTKPY